MNKIVRIMSVAVMAVLSAQMASASPEVTSLEMKQGPYGRLVTISYTLSEAPAVVTLDIETNCVENGTEKWASIGGEHIWNANGAVWKKVTSADANGEGKYTISWRPDKSWTGANGDGFVLDGVTKKARAKLTAWPIDNTPDYMVVDISEGAQSNTQKYYPAVEFLPGSVPGQKGAITNNPIYKTSMLVMRKIMAGGVTWTMGSTVREIGRDSSKESTHQVCLENNYYIGVFEVTQGQWSMLPVNRRDVSYFTNRTFRAMRPVECVGYNEIRCSPSNRVSSADAKLHYWPGEPHPNSFLGLLRARTGIDFDLPSEAQWEFACRAGNGDSKWNDGSDILKTGKDSNLNVLGRYAKNGGTPTGENANANYYPSSDCGPENGTAIVGSYKQNSWGIYDMHGNVMEWCLDWYEADISKIGGKVNVNPLSPEKTSSGAVPAENRRVYRGGSWVKNASILRSAARASGKDVNNYWNAVNLMDCEKGFRLVCTAGLK